MRDALPFVFDVDHHELSRPVTLHMEAAGVELLTSRRRIERRSVQIDPAAVAGDTGGLKLTNVRVRVIQALGHGLGSLGEGTRPVKRPARPPPVSAGSASSPRLAPACA